MCRASAQPFHNIRPWFAAVMAGSAECYQVCDGIGFGNRPRNDVVNVCINIKYFEIACRRVDEATRQPDMFIQPPPPQPMQEGFDL